MIENTQSQHSKKKNLAMLNSKLENNIQFEVEDEFQINEQSFKPVTRGLGFHQDTKKNVYRAVSKPTVNREKDIALPATTSLNQLVKSSSKNISNAPHGLEAFYGTTASSLPSTPLTSQSISINKEGNAAEAKSDQKKQIKQKSAPVLHQFLAWVLDITLVASFVLLTSFLLVAVSGIEFSTLQRVLKKEDIIYFSVSIFSIYYMVYFSILDLSSSPGKLIFGLKLVKIDGTPVGVKQTFNRAFVSLFSGIALFLPMLLDFQGKLSDTKVVKQ